MNSDQVKILDLEARVEALERAGDALAHDLIYPTNAPVLDVWWKLRRNSDCHVCCPREKAAEKPVDVQDVPRGTDDEAIVFRVGDQVAFDGQCLRIVRRAYMHFWSCPHYPSAIENFGRGRKACDTCKDDGVFSSTSATSTRVPT